MSRMKHAEHPAAPAIRDAVQRYHLSRPTEEPHPVPVAVPPNPSPHAVAATRVLVWTMGVVLHSTVDATQSHTGRRHRAVAGQCRPALGDGTYGRATAVGTFPDTGRRISIP